MKKYSAQSLILILFLSAAPLLFGNGPPTLLPGSDDPCCPHLRTNRSGIQEDDSSPLVRPLQRREVNRIQSISAPDAIILPGYSAAGFTNLAELIAGRVAGVQVSSGYQAYRIRIRGAQGPPVLVVNDMPFRGDDEYINGVLQMIPPVDVASIEIYKSAAGAVRYGPQAGNGVIVVRMKTGDEDLD